jgi:hypothetical protein
MRAELAQRRNGVRVPWFETSSVRLSAAIAAVVLLHPAGDVGAGRRGGAHKRVRLARP